ncbi:MFS transporter [Methyloglobulus sp.]|uniref:MFS transporter n=1 Tax=Methyloglobulus sp. TaxID=2518622 RepID=UPI0032B7D9E6
MPKQPFPKNVPALTHKLMALYGLPHLIHSMVILPLVLFIPSYYADDLGLPLASVGMAIAISRLLDVFTDPIMGILSDRWHTRWGRRKPWLVLGTPSLILSTWMVFVPSGKVSVVYLFIWTSLLFLSFDIFDLPYKAWGAELSTDYKERSRVAAWREAFGASGHIIFLLILMVMGFWGYHGNREQLLVIALIICICLPLFVVLAVAKVPERPPEQLHGQSHLGWTGMKLVFRNNAFIRTLIALVLFGTGLMIQATLHKMVLKHVVGRPELFSSMILAETIVSLLALPLWVWFSDRIGKHRALAFAGLWIGLWGLALPLVGYGDIELYVTLIVFRGSSIAAIIFLSNSIAADVIDHDTVASGHQRTGFYFSLWGMAIKMAIGLGVFLGTSLPAHFGFDPSVASHSPVTEFALMRIYGWLPFFIMLLAFPLLWNYPITREKQQELRAQIDARRK